MTEEKLIIANQLKDRIAILREQLTSIEYKLKQPDSTGFMNAITFRRSFNDLPLALFSDETKHEILVILKNKLDIMLIEATEEFNKL